MELLQNFWVIQAIGAIALVFIFLSWNAKERKNIFFLQSINLVFFTIHYLLLAAYAGAAMCVVVLARNFVFSRKGEEKWASHPAWLYGFIALAIGFLLVLWDGWITLFPIVGIIFGTYAMWNVRPADIRFFMLMSALVWIPYVIFVGSYPGLLNQIVATVGILGAFAYGYMKREHPDWLKWLKDKFKDDTEDFEPIARRFNLKAGVLSRLSRESYVDFMQGETKLDWASEKLSDFVDSPPSKFGRRRVPFLDYEIPLSGVSLAEVQEVRNFLKDAVKNPKIAAKLKEYNVDIGDKETSLASVFAVLNKMGADITPNDRTYTIRGVKKLGGFDHTPIPDRLEVASWACIAAATNGRIYVENANPEHLHAFLEKFDEAGCGYSIQDNGITFWRKEEK